MAPCSGLLLRVGIVPEHFTELFPGFQLNHSGQRTRFHGDIVGIVDHCHEVSQQPGDRQIGAHVAFISRGPERHGLPSQKFSGLLHGFIEVLGETFERFGILNGFCDEFLGQHYISPGLWCGGRGTKYTYVVVGIIRMSGLLDLGQNCLNVLVEDTEILCLGPDEI